jgi:chromosome segregation ATPase
LAVFPPEDPDNRLQIARRGRPIGSRKKQPDGTVPEPSQIAIMGQEIMRLEILNNNFKNELDVLKNRFGADTLRVQDITLERERLLSRITLLERTLDEVRSESASKDGRIYELKSEKDKYLSRIEKLETTLSEMAMNTKEPAKKSLIEKIFA